MVGWSETSEEVKYAIGGCTDATAATAFPVQPDMKVGEVWVWRFEKTTDGLTIHFNDKQVNRDGGCLSVSYQTEDAVYNVHTTHCVACLKIQSTDHDYREGVVSYFSKAIGIMTLLHFSC